MLTQRTNLVVTEHIVQHALHVLLAKATRRDAFDAGEDGCDGFGLVRLLLKIEEAVRAAQHALARHKHAPTQELVPGGRLLLLQLARPREDRVEATGAGGVTAGPLRVAAARSHLLRSQAGTAEPRAIVHEFHLAAHQEARTIAQAIRPRIVREAARCSVRGP